MSSNVSQSYPYSSESEEQRAAAIAKAFEEFEGLSDRVAEEITPLGDAHTGENGAPPTWWIWVCPKDDFSGRLHVAGFARERHALFTVCDTCGSTYLR